jgi:hypothetical protein
MQPVLLDAAGHRRSPATMPGYHRGRPPRNKGETAGLILLRLSVSHPYETGLPCRTEAAAAGVERMRAG